MTRGLQTCLTFAFLALMAKLVGTYGVYSFAQSLHDSTTFNEIVRLSLTGDAARDFVRDRARGSGYLASTLHLQVAFIAAATMAYATAMGGNRRVAAALCLLVLVGIPVDLPLGLVHLVQNAAGTPSGLPSELTWSWLPRSPFFILRRISVDQPIPYLTTEGVMTVAAFMAIMIPGMLSATVVLAGMRTPRLGSLPADVPSQAYATA